MWGASEDVDPSDYRTGTLSVSGEDYSPDGQTSTPISYSGPLDPWNPNPMYPFVCNGGYLQIELNTSESTMFRWVRDLDWETWEPDPNDNPPDVLHLLVEYSAGGTAESDGNVPHTNHDPNKEFVRVQVLDRSIDSQDGKTDPGEVVGATNTMGAIHGKRLFKVETHGQELVAAPRVTFSATAGLLGGRFINQNGSYAEPVSGWAEPWTQYSAHVDSRSVQVSRTAAVGETFNPSTNTTTGDTRYSYDNYAEPLTFSDHTAHTNWQTFTAPRSGNWSSTPQWSWSPTGGVILFDPDTIDKTDQEMPKGTAFKNTNGNWQGTSGVGTHTVTYTLTDPTDGANTTATYVLSLHDEWENLRADPAKPPTVQHYYEPAGPSANNFWVGNANGPGDMTGTWTQTITAGTTFTYGFEAGFTVADLVNLGGSFTQSAEQSIGTTGGSNSPPIPVGKHSYPYVDLHWNRTYHLIDHYVPAGQDANSARSDVSWEQWVDNYGGGFSSLWSAMYDIHDFDGDGLPD